MRRFPQVVEHCLKASLFVFFSNLCNVLSWELKILFCNELKANRLYMPTF